MVLLRIVLPLALLLAAGCRSRQPEPLQMIAEAHARMLAAQQRPAAEAGGGRPTSVPYSGDPSIFDTPGRDEKLQIDRVMNLLGVGPGKAVADIGAGGGWFTVRAARRVEPGGVVWAEDINPAAVKYISDRAAKEDLTDVRAVLGTPDDPRLPAQSVDAVMMLKMYHEIARPVVVMGRVREALRPGAKVGIIDRNGNGSGTDHGVPEATVTREMEQAGFVQVGRWDFVKGDGEDYLLVFRAK